LTDRIRVSGDTLARYQSRRAGDKVIASKNRVLSEALEMGPSRVRHEEEKVIVNLDVGEGRSGVEKDVVPTIVELGITD
jgi:hypothetical protein